MSQVSRSRLHLTRRLTDSTRRPTRYEGLTAVVSATNAVVELTILFVLENGMVESILWRLATVV